MARASVWPAWSLATNSSSLLIFSLSRSSNDQALVVGAPSARTAPCATDNSSNVAGLLTKNRASREDIPIRKGTPGEHTPHLPSVMGKFVLMTSYGERHYAP